MAPFSIPVWPAFCQDVFPAAIAIGLQSTLLLLCGLLAGSVLRRYGPATQAAAYRAALVGILLAALAPLLPARSSGPGWSVPLPQSVLPPIAPAVPPLAMEARRPQAATAASPGGTATALAAAPRRELSASQPASIISRGQARGEWLCIGAVTLWAGGTGLCLGWLCLGLLRVGQLRRRGALMTDGPAVDLLESLCEPRSIRAPELRASEQVDGPLLLGGRRPAILLPAADIGRIESTTLRAILIHELAHRDRRDDTWSLFAQFLRALIWPQPLLWVVCRRIEAASEEACDAAVLREGIAPKAYAECLLTLAERFVARPAERGLGLGVVPYRSSIGRRVQQIMAHCPRAMPTLSGRARAGIALGAAPAVLLTVLLIAPSGRPSGPSANAAPLGTAANDPAHPLVSVEAARRQLSFPLFVPRSLPEDAGLLGVLVSVPEIANLSEVLHYTHSHQWIMQGYGLTILPSHLIWPGSRGWAVNTMPGSPAAQAGIGPRARPLLALNGRSMRSGQELHRALSSLAPLRVTFLGRDGRARTVTLRRRTYISGPGTPEIPHTREAALSMTYRGRSWEIIEQPTPENPRKPRNARHLRVGRRDISVYGTREVHTAFWREAGVDLTLNNRAGMTEAQVARVIRAMHAEPPIAPGPSPTAAAPPPTPEATITGRVVDARGRPAPGMRVTAEAQRGVRGARLWAEDTSRADGSYRLAGLQTAPYNVVAEDPSQQRVAAAGEGVAAEVGKTVHAPDLVLTPGAIVEGTVTDTRSGRPLGAAQVVSLGPALPASSAMTLAAMVDPKGHYRLRVAPGANRICVNVVGTSARDRLYPAGTPPGVPVVVKEGETKIVPLKVDGAIFPVWKPVRHRPIPMGYGG